MKNYMVTKAQGFMIYIPGTETFLSDEMDLFQDPHEFELGLHRFKIYIVLD